MEHRQHNNDFIVEIQASALRRCRNRTTELASQKSDYIPDILIMVSTVSICFLIEIFCGGVHLKSPLELPIIVIITAVTVACIVVFYFLKSTDVINSSQKAKLILEDLPDPDFISPEARKILTGDWTFESTTRQSNKKANGIISFSSLNNQITASGSIIGESMKELGVIISQNCILEAQTIKILYNVSIVNDNGLPDNSDCKMIGYLDPQNNRIEGHWYKLDGKNSGGFQLSKISK